MDYSSLINGEDTAPVTYSIEPRVTEKTWIEDRDSYDWYNGLSDPDVSTVNKKKIVTLHENQVNLTSESFSQFIPFEIDRYQDGIDLITNNISIGINYTVPGDITVRRAKVVNVQYTSSGNRAEDKILFYWPVSGDVTATEGKVAFSISADGTIRNGKGESYPYSWKSRLCELTIVKAVGDGEIIEFSEDYWQTILLERVTDKVTSIVTKEALGEHYYNKDEVDAILGNIEKPDLAPYVAKDDIELTLNDENYTLTFNYGGEAPITIDLPLETMVVNGEYDSVNKKIILTLKNNNKIEISIADIISTDLATDSEVTVAITEALNNYYTKEEINTTVATVNEKFGTLQREEGIDLTVQEYVDSIDISNRLGNLGTITEGEGEEQVTRDRTVEEFVNNEFANKLGNLGTITEGEGEGQITRDRTVEEFVDNEFTNKLGDLDGQTVQEYVTTAIDNVDVTEELEELAKEFENKLNIGESESVAAYVDSKIGDIELDGYATEQYVGQQLNNYYTETETNQILQAYDTSEQVDEKVAAAKAKEKSYELGYNNPDDIDGGKDTLVLYEITKDSDGNPIKTSKGAYVITGGSGAGATIKINRITPDNLKVRAGQAVSIQYSFEITDAAGESINSAMATWKIGSKVYGSERVYSRDELTGQLKANSFNIADLSAGYYEVALQIKETNGTSYTLFWNVRVIEINLTTSFDDTNYVLAGTACNFPYRISGAVEKTVYFEINGSTFSEPYLSTESGLKEYSLGPYGHGHYLLKTYMTATIGIDQVSTEPIYKDILFYDPNASSPLIGTIYDNFEVDQYTEFEIPITFYDPENLRPTFSIYRDGNLEVTETLTNTNTYIYKFEEETPGEHIIEIDCRGTSRVLHAKVNDLNIGVKPITSGLAFDFNPKIKTAEDREWSDRGVTLQTSSNFDWDRGGFGVDKDGVPCFKVKTGTWAKINYKLFGNNAKERGKEFKVIFKTENVYDRDTTFLSCLSGQETKVGLEMKVEEANIYYGGASSLSSLYSENERMEFEFNINSATFKDGKLTSGTPLIQTYEDGVPYRPLQYTAASSFLQAKDPQDIIIGGEDCHCDILIYRMKAYEQELSNKDILQNFIVDAPTTPEMIKRYNANLIYGERLEGGIKAYFEGDLDTIDPEILAELCPDLKIIMLEAPVFTNKKSNTIQNTSIRMIHKNGGDANNWYCTNASHSGQGTSSDEYGAAGRNIHVYMDNEESVVTYQNDNNVYRGKDGIALSEGSIPANVLNIKLNIASSENANNALLAERYNQFNPFLRTARLFNPNVRDTMEFHNCVVFIKENSETETHREFNDTNWHFYGIGNIGDSKKTDATRVNNPNDPKECIVEITDAYTPLSSFPTGYYTATGEQTVCPSGEWKAGNPAYDNLYADPVWEKENANDPDENAKISKFGNGSYEFRYIKSKKKKNSEDIMYCIDKWREFYKFVVTSDKKTFIRDLNKYFVVDSALFYYLFTERYTMVDNRAKNSFWHYGKVYYSESEIAALDENLRNKIPNDYIDDEKASFNDGYRWDLSFGYDMDTALGIDNLGDMVFSYGVEDTDAYSGNEDGGGEAFRASKSTFFTNIRDYLGESLELMFKNRENNGAWSSDTLISTFDRSQAEFPEELWRLDYQRKYFRSEFGLSLDNSIKRPAQNFLTGKYNGRKKYQRRMYERNQELYMSTKYLGVTATTNNIRIRFTNPLSYGITPDYSLTVVPYSKMYVGYSFFNGHSDKIKAEPGQEITLKYPIQNQDNIGADITLIYGASFIKEIKGLATCYPGNDTSFSNATRLRRLELGASSEKSVDILANIQSSSSQTAGKYVYIFDPINTDIFGKYINIKIDSITQGEKSLPTNYFKLEKQNIQVGQQIQSKYFIVLAQSEGDEFASGEYKFTVKYDEYFNANMNGFEVKENPLLEYLDIRNITNLNEDINLSSCESLTTLYATGAGKAPILLPASAPIETLHLQDSISITMKNLYKLQDFKIDGVNNLERIILENCPINSYSILANASKLQQLKMTGLNWINIQDDTHINRAYNMTGFDDKDEGQGNSVLKGQAYIDNGRRYWLNKYEEKWPEFLIYCNNITEQATVTFINDGAKYDEKVVDIGGKVIDPTSEGKTPTKAPTTEKEYTFNYWTTELNNPDTRYSFNTPVTNNLILYAYYSDSPRQYTIQFYSNGTAATPLYEKQASYGDYVFCPEIPVDISKENSGLYKLFNGWDKSGYVDSDKKIYARYEEYTYNEGDLIKKKLEDLSRVEVYAISKKYPDNAKYRQDGLLRIPLGNNIEYDDITSRIALHNPYGEQTVQEFTGSTIVDSEEKLFRDDRDFTLAVDFKLANIQHGNSVVFACREANGGFDITTNNNRLNISWGTPSNSSNVVLETSLTSNREIIVIKHKKGSKQLDVYYSKTNAESPEHHILTAPTTLDSIPSLKSTLLFGGREQMFSQCSIYWSKLWDVCLGDEECEQLAAWPHEELELQSMSIYNAASGGYSKVPYYYGPEGNETQTELTLMSTHLLNMQSSLIPYGNNAGWSASSIRDYLNNRLYNGINSLWRPLIKQINVASDTRKDGSISSMFTKDYIFIPSARELIESSTYLSSDSAPTSHGCFDIFVDNEARKCTLPGSNTALTYWTRSARANSALYWLYVSTTGSVTSTSSDSSYYIRIMLAI